MKILVLGGLGKQGRVISEELVKADPSYQVAIADSGYGVLPDGITHFINADLSDYKKVFSLVDSNDLVVCALPSQLGFNCVKAAVETATNMVDLSFSSEDLSVFDKEAKAKGIAIIHDAGVAPGLSNLVAGRAMLDKPNSIDIMVGGVAQDKDEPFGYTITWNVDDLIEEYTRPARILVDGEIQTVDALSDCKTVSVQDLTLEAFYSDGLRSLLYNNGGVPNLSEKTLRWPGHVEEISKYLKDGTASLKSEILKKCKVGAPDVLVMKIESEHGVATVTIGGDDNMSAMARGTALSCSTFASLVASGLLKKTGVLPPEKLAEDMEVYEYILDKMATYGVEFNTKFPFMKGKTT